MTSRHAQEREQLKHQHDIQEQQEAQEHQARFAKGLTGLWHRLSGKHSQICKDNALEAQASLQERQAQNDELIRRQLAERQALQERLTQTREAYRQELDDIRRAVFKHLPDEQVIKLDPAFTQNFDQQPTYNMEM